LLDAEADFLYNETTIENEKREKVTFGRAWEGAEKVEAYCVSYVI